MSRRYAIVPGYFGWSNTRSGEEFYTNSEGRWRVEDVNHPDHGDLLYTSMNYYGVTEGAQLIVIGSTTRFIDDEEFDELLTRIHQTVQEFENEKTN